MKDDVGCIKLDILLLTDLSSSVSGQEEFIHDAAYAFIDKFDLADDGIRIGLISFSSLAYLHSHLNSDKDSLKGIINSVIAPRMSGGSTNLLNALHLSTNEMLENGRVGVLKMIIIITDGEPDDVDDVIKEATLIKTLPATMIWGIYVKKEVKIDMDDTNPMIQMMYGSAPTFTQTHGSEILKKIASPNCFVEANYENLVKEIKKMDICI